ncbi:MAG TPA: VWA domain-containing protein [Candidatus Nitrosopolaris sp.]|nr:VWA domain-containing protein [Candidatus Nitrosopolaris sp.]
MTLPFGLGALHVAAPSALLALLVVPLFGISSSPGRRLRVATWCRAFAAFALVLALAGLCLERPRPAAGSCVIAGIDVSTSVGRAAADRARDFFRRIVPALAWNDVLGSITFAGQARVQAYPTAGRRAVEELVPAADDDLDALEREESDLALVPARAASLCPAGKQSSLLLFTDGNETAGSLLAEATLLEPRIPIFPVVPATTALPSAVIRRVLVPALAPARSVLPFETVVENRAAVPVSGALALSVNGRPMLPLPVDLPPGPSLVAAPFRLPGRGEYLVEARLLLPPVLPAPGPVDSVISAMRPLHVLVVTEHDAPVVAAVLASRGLAVDTIPPADLGTPPDALRDYHAVVLDDVARAGLADTALSGLTAWVAAGGALVVTGGGHLFGDAGFTRSPLADVLPVALASQNPQPAEREPIALYLLIDRSNSMGYASGALPYGEKMEYAKRAALAVLDQLAPQDLVGAIAFDSQPYELGALMPVAPGRAALSSKIARLRYGGGTDFKDALDIARRNLVASGRRVRHVILLTDGDTNRHAEDHVDLIAALAADRISVTTIRIGDDTVNLELLQTISRETGGLFHHVEDLDALPQLMISDTRRLIDTAPYRDGAAPRIGEPGAMLAGIAEPELPAVARWAVTRARPGAEIRLYVDIAGRRDPILATWQYELGRVAALPVDFQAGAASWPRWQGFARLWTQLLLWAAAPALPGERRLVAERAGDHTRIQLYGAGDESAPVVLRLPEVGDVALSRTGRTFQAVVPRLSPGHHAAWLRTGQAPEEPVELVVPAASGGREYRTAAPNRALLEEVAALTGGRVDPDPRDVLAARAGIGRRVIPLEGVLIPLVLVLVLADVALRRWPQ